MNRLYAFFPWIVGMCVAAFLFVIVASASAPADGPLGMPIESLARIPVSASGRTKPLDTFARNSLLKISGRQSFEADGGERRPAIEWLLEVWTKPQLAQQRRVFRIDHPDVLSLLGINAPGRTRFSWKEIEPKLNEVERQSQLASQLPSKKQDPFQRQVIALFQKLIDYSELQSLSNPYMVAPLEANEEWVPLINPKTGTFQTGRASADALKGILSAYAGDDVTTVRRLVSAYHDGLGVKLASVEQAGEYEVLLNRCEPFYQASILYVLAFLIGCSAMLLRSLSPQGWVPSLMRSALVVIGIAFAIHTLGLVARIYLQGRPPVTNLYSSAVFIGWACIPVALVGEWFQKFGILPLVASLIGFSTLIVAHNLSTSGDTMEMMQAVLDSNFWLATHVVVVTIGYSATFLAGLLACLYLIGGTFTTLFRDEPIKAIPRMIYGVICFASVTSFVGTVLGGIWADQSWGRFWGWDPKENGAAMIVVWNLLILHARWGGMVRERGVAVLAVAGNIVTAWSWFGTNMLGVGLHSYGFMDSAVFWLLAFCGLQLAIMTIGFVPASRWRSLTPTATSTSGNPPSKLSKDRRQPA